MDEATSEVVFAELYDSHVNSRQFPDLAPAANMLGIVDRRGRLHFSDRADAVELRRAIMGPVQGLPAVAQADR